MFDVANYADDLHPGDSLVGLGAKLEIFAEWRLVGEISVGHALVDDDNDGGVLAVVGVGHPASLEERDLEQLEIAGADDAIVGHDEFAGTLGWMILNVEVNDRAGSADGEE